MPVDGRVLGRVIGDGVRLATTQSGRRHKAGDGRGKSLPAGEVDPGRTVGQVKAGPTQELGSQQGAVGDGKSYESGQRTVRRLLTFHGE